MTMSIGSTPDRMLAEFETVAEVIARIQRETSRTGSLDPAPTR